MAALKGSKTEENLKAAFAGESQANRRYLYFANKADVEGQNDVAALFRSTAEGETGHAHGHLEWLEQCGDPATGLPIGRTRDNLQAAVAGCRACALCESRKNTVFGIGPVAADDAAPQVLIELVPEDRVDQAGRRALLRLTPAAPAATWGWTALSPFRSGYRWRWAGQADWSAATSPTVPLQLRSSLDPTRSTP
jgi:hypothetical protein